MRTHVFNVGKSGVGKSVECLTVAADLAWRTRKKRRCSISLLEPHGDLAKDFLFLRFNTKKYWNRLIYVNPVIHKMLGIEDIYSPVLNFFDIPYRDEDSIDAFSQQITNAFKQMLQKKKTNDEGLSRNMDAVIKPCIATLLRKGDADLRDLKRFMSKDNKDLVALGLKSPDPEHRHFFEYGFAVEQFNVTKNALFIKLQSLLNSPVFRRLVVGNGTNNKSTIDLHKAFNS